MNKTPKEYILSIIFDECEDDIYKYRELRNLIDKMDESQLKELEGYLYVTQVSSYQTIHDYAEELEII